MTELPPRAAALLEAARREHNPSQADRERVHAALFSALALPLSPPESSRDGAVEAPRPMPPAPGPAAGFLGGVGIKLVLVVSLTLGGVGFWALDSFSGPTNESSRASITASPPSARTAPETTAKPALSESTPKALTAPTAELPLSLRRAESKQDSKTAPSLPDERGAKRAAHAVRNSPPARAPQVAEAPSSTLSASAPSDGSESAVASDRPQALRASNSAPPSAYGELLLIRRALSALRAGAPETALRVLAEHRASYPMGAMVSEREGLYALALCEGGQFEAGRRQKSEFLRIYGASPIAARVKAACQGAP